MRDEYQIENLNPRLNPYVSKKREQITIKIDGARMENQGGKRMELHDWKDRFASRILGRGADYYYDDTIRAMNRREE